MIAPIADRSSKYLPHYCIVKELLSNASDTPLAVLTRYLLVSIPLFAHKNITPLNAFPDLGSGGRYICLSHRRWEATFGKLGSYL
jgi:hypothetical protein